MKALWPFIKLFKQQWPMMSLGLFLTLLSLVAAMALLALSGWFITAAALAGLSLASAQAFNYLTPAGGVRFLSILRTASRYAERIATHEATFNLLTKLRVWAWRKILPLSERNLQSQRQADVLNRLVADIDTLDHLYLRLLSPMLATLLALCLLYLFVSYFDPHLALVMALILLISCITLPTVFYFLGRKPGVDILESKRAYRIHLLEFLQGMAELSLFSAKGRFRKQLEREEGQLLVAQSAMARVKAWSQAASIGCHGLLVGAVLYLASFGFAHYQPPGALFALMVFLSLASFELLMPIAGAFQHLSACMAAATRVNDLLEQESDIHFVETSPEISQGRIEVQNLNFSYQADAEQKVLKGINLSIKAGEKHALLGQTGCGKSTLLSLLTRQWAAGSGQICIDGEHIENYSQSALYAGMSVVSQRVYLFSDSLKNNLLLAQADASDEDLIEVLHKVGLDTLTEGERPLEQWIGEGGRQLSGGERRRIGVARVLLRNAPILLLDEVTEGLDKTSEREILALLLDFAKDKSMLMISHRLSALQHMDCIHLMEEGRLRCSGRHEDLLKRDEYYASLHRQLL